MKTFKKMLSRMETGVEPTFNISILWVFVSPIIIFLMVVVVIIPLDTGVSTSSIPKFWLFSHLLLIIIGHLAFFLAFIVGVLYILHDKITLTELLTIDVLDFSIYIFLSLGFTMLAFGLISWQTKVCCHLENLSKSCSIKGR